MNDLTLMEPASFCWLSLDAAVSTDSFRYISKS